MRRNGEAHGLPEEVGLGNRSGSACVIGCVLLGGMLASAGARVAIGQQVTYDLVILHGRVMDPESGLDAARNVGIKDGKVRRLTTGPLTGRDTIEARGLVVAPGFIDLHQHAQDSAAYLVEARDGTTSALELENGTADVGAWYAARRGRSLINYGVSVGHVPVRMAVMHDAGPDVPTTDAAHRVATDAELAEISRRLTRGLDEGAVAVGYIIAFTPAATPWEILEGFRIAAAHHASVHVHLRDVPDSLGFIETEEVIAGAAVTGAAVQIVHIASSGQADTPRLLELVRGARARGLDITTECYPYTASMVEINSSGSDGWRGWSDAKFARMEWPATGERLTRETFERYRAQGGEVVVHNNTEAVVRGAIMDPLTMIATDGILSGGIGHPRVAGSFAKVLAYYVRETGAISLMDALRKMTLMPAQRLEARVPTMRNKGRVKVGGDADLVVFDAGTILDRATYREPTLPPTGMPYVVVNGVPIIRRGAAIETAHPGRPIRAVVAVPVKGAE